MAEPRIQRWKIDQLFIWDMRTGIDCTIGGGEECNQKEVMGLLEYQAIPSLRDVARS